MTELEKVIRGLENCLGFCCNGCCPKECPYISDGKCYETIKRDALALLKAKVPRVMTLDQVCGGDECWIEYKFGGHGYADVYLSDELDGTALVYRCRPVGDRKPETVWLHDYGKLWRGWSYRPTEEQRKAVKWDET